MSYKAAIVAKLRQLPHLHLMPTYQRRREIQIALMDVPGADPDNAYLIDEIDRQLGKMLPRLKSIINISDDKLAELLGKSRPTIQAYNGGRLRELLSRSDCDRLLVVARKALDDLTVLIRDIETLREHADA